MNSRHVASDRAAVEPIPCHRYRGAASLAERAIHNGDKAVGCSRGPSCGSRTAKKLVRRGVHSDNRAPLGAAMHEWRPIRHLAQVYGVQAAVIPNHGRKLPIDQIKCRCSVELM